MGFISPIQTDSNGAPVATGSQKVLGKDDFLQLLVTKLRYQDPMDPMSDGDYIAQLAQFSTLEQMNNISNGITTSNEWDFLQMQSLNNVMATGLIGKDVKANYQGFYVDHEGESNINYTLDEYANEVNFVIKNTSGTVVANLTQNDVESGTNTINWDGTDTQGNWVEEGFYYVEATATSIAGNSFTPSLSLVGKVESVIYHNGSAFLYVNGTEIPLGDITAVGEPGSFDEEE